MPADFQVLVRYGSAGLVGRFGPTDPHIVCRRGDRVLIHSERGHEIGEVLGLTPSRIAWPALPVVSGELLGLASASDCERLVAVQSRCSEALAAADRLVSELGLPATVLDLEAVIEPDAFVLHLARSGPADVRPLVAQLSRLLDAAIQVRDLTDPSLQQAAATGCGSGNCGSGCGSDGGCGSGGGCSTSGGCGSGCGSQPPEVFERDWQDFFAERRALTQRRIALPV
ncbi:MAG TPA: hypothetical protein PKD86_03195 [Gemmatales bacterium]|nr:hypothetical protein [Gemmatales bacterium]